VALELPFFDRNQGTSVQLHAEFDALMERYHGLAIDLRSAAREAVSRVSSAHARARHFQEVILPAQERVTAQTLLQYNAMQLGVFHVLSARREQLNAEFAYVDTLAEYWSSVAALNAILAGTRVSSAEVGRSDLTPSVTDEEGGH
jgi:outer membrane protein TolC